MKLTQAQINALSRIGIQVLSNGEEYKSKLEFVFRLPIINDSVPRDPYEGIETIIIVEKMPLNISEEDVKTMLKKLIQLYEMEIAHVSSILFG